MSATEKSSYELFYFPLPGRAEASRMLLQYAKANWTERNPTNWEEEKPKTPFGCLPVLIERREDGSEVQIGESHTIERYLARKFGLLGSDEYEAALIDSYCEGWSSLITAMASARFEKSDVGKEAGEAAFKTVAKDIINYHGKQLAKNGNGYYVGNSLSLVDIVAYTTLLLAKGFGFDNLDNVPEFNKLRETVQNNPVIGSYAKERLDAYKAQSA